MSNSIGLYSKIPKIFPPRSSNFNTTLSTTYLKSDSRIINLGAINHMTRNPSMFCSYTPFNGTRTVKIVDVP